MPTICQKYLMIGQTITVIIFIKKSFFKNLICPKYNVYGIYSGQSWLWNTELLIT